MLFLTTGRLCAVSSARAVAVGASVAVGRIGVAPRVRGIHFVLRNPFVVVAVEFPQSFASLAEFGGIERAVAIRIEDAEKARRDLWRAIMVGPARRFRGSGVRRARWGIVLGTQDTCGKRERGEEEGRVSFHGVRG
jgi:hypothetical protein